MIRDSHIVKHMTNLPRVTRIVYHLQIVIMCESINLKKPLRHVHRQFVVTLKSPVNMAQSFVMFQSNFRSKHRFCAIIIKYMFKNERRHQRTNRKKN